MERENILLSEAWEKYSPDKNEGYSSLSLKMSGFQYNLLKPSVVCTSKIISVHGSELRRHLGELPNHDSANVLNMRRELF